MSALLDKGINAEENDAIDILAPRQLTINRAPVLPALGLGGGKVFYVDPTNGSDLNSGTGPSSSHSLATLQAAIDKCVSWRGDVIVRLPGTETVTATVAVNKQGITIMGTTGGGNMLKPDYFLTTTDTASIHAVTVTARCNIIGLSFSAFTPAYSGLYINYGFVLVQNCLFAHTAGESIGGIEIAALGTTHVAGVDIVGCSFYNFNDADDHPILYTGAAAADCKTSRVLSCDFYNCHHGISHGANSGCLGFVYAYNNVIPTLAPIATVVQPAGMCLTEIKDSGADIGKGMVMRNFIPVENLDGVDVDSTAAQLATCGVLLAANELLGAIPV